MHFTARRADDGIISIHIKDEDGLHPIAVLHPQRGDLEVARFLVRGANALLARRGEDEDKDPE